MRVRLHWRALLGSGMSQRPQRHEEMALLQFLDCSNCKDLVYFGYTLRSRVLNMCLQPLWRSDKPFTGAA